MDEFSEKTHDVERKVKCKNCGAQLRFDPGVSSLSCDYCGVKNDISEEMKPVEVEEIDFESFINNAVQQADTMDVATVKCDNCGASTSLRPNVTSDACPFCDTPLIIKGGSIAHIIKPKYMLPFSIDKKKGITVFTDWLHKLWFAPNDLKKYAENDKLRGLYIPYWTYDSKTVSQYSGMRGIHYYTTETYTVNGQTQTRSVQRTNWTPASGTVYNEFDDILINASNSLPEKYVNELEPWDLHALTGFNEQFLSGFVSEQYQVQVKDGFEKAKIRMQPPIRSSAMNDIGGDVQQVLSLNTEYNEVTFKHILLPIWLSAYKYNGKVYRFMINGRTGEVQGERPYSAWKIFFLVATIVAVIGVGIYLYSKNK
jgi:DNA-directed RNA polymerase subunit RPC12/RpoP